LGKKTDVENIIKQIHALFGDTSVSKEITLEFMEEIEEAAAMNAEAIRNELKQELRQR